MTATDRLRALLDERGVEWEEAGYDSVAATFWYDNGSFPVTAIDGTDDCPEGMVSLGAFLPPEQAVEATLGRGTCHARNDEDTCGHDVCSECGFVWPDDYSIRYCPNCGRRVVE